MDLSVDQHDYYGNVDQKRFQDGALRNSAHISSSLGSKVAYRHK